MTSPNSAFTEVVTTSLQSYSGQIADNVSKGNVLFNRLNKGGNKQTATGRSIVQELEYAENATVKWYSGYDTLDTSPSEVLSAAEFSYKQIAGNVVISGLEQIQNSGKEAVHNLLKSRIRNLEKSLRNAMGTGVYALGTGSSSKELGGLRLIVADAGAGTVGGIDSSTYTFWKNQFDTTATDPTSSTIQGRMNDMYIDCTRGTDKPNLIVADKIYYTAYLESLQANQRFTDDKEASAGFTNLMFMGAPVVYDDLCPANHMYFLNTDYLFLRPAKGREFVPLGERASINQDALVVPVVWAGNLTCSNRDVQGVLLNT